MDKLDSLPATPGSDWPVVPDAYDEWDDIAVESSSAKQTTNESKTALADDNCVQQEDFIDGGTSEVSVNNGDEFTVSVGGCQEELDDSSRREMDGLIVQPSEAEHAGMGTREGMQNEQTEFLQSNCQTTCSQQGIMGIGSEHIGKEGIAGTESDQTENGRIGEAKHEEDNGERAQVNVTSSLNVDDAEVSRSIEETMDEILKETEECDIDGLNAVVVSEDSSKLEKTVFVETASMMPPSIEEEMERHGSASSKRSVKSLNFVSDHYGSDTDSLQSEDSTTESLRDVAVGQ